MAALPNKATGTQLKTALIQTRCSLTNPPICYPISIKVDKTTVGEYDTRGQTYMEARKALNLTGSPDAENLTLGTELLDELVKKAPIVTAGELSLKPPPDLDIVVPYKDTEYTINKEFIKPDDSVITWESSNTDNVTVDKDGKLTIIYDKKLEIPYEDSAQSVSVRSTPPVNITAKIGNGDKQKVVFGLKFEKKGVTGKRKAAETLAAENAKRAAAAAEKTAAAAKTEEAEAAAKAPPTLKLKVDDDKNKRIVIDDTAFINKIPMDLFTVTPNNAKITWTSSNNKAVTVDDTGKIEIVDVALIVPETPVTITASVGDAEDQKIVFTLVMKPNEVLKPTLERIGDEGVLTQTIKGIKIMLNLTQFIQVPKGVVPTWESSDAAIATVNNEGNVISHNPGEATITAYVGENASKSDSNQKVSFTVTVEEEQFGGRRRSKGTVRQKLGKLRRRMGTRAKKQ